MADLSPSNSSASKKKTKKKKRKVGTSSDTDTSSSPQEQVNKYPKQTIDRDEPTITTTKCTFCGKTLRQITRGGRNEANRIVTCESCIKLGISSEDDVKTVIDGYTTPRAPVKENLCNCIACVNKRENAVTPEVERDAHITQSYWMEIRHVVRCIYRDSMNISDLSTRENIGSDKMRTIVQKLCSRDPHQFFQRLETLAREYLLEVKVRLLEQLSCGFNSPQLAIEFIQMLLDEYSTLCTSLPGLLFLLEPLESTDYVKRLGLTIELVNKNIFRELIFAESFMSSNLPLIIAQLRLASLSSDPFHRSTADSLSQRYISLDKEMEDIGKVWKSAKEQLHLQHQEFKKHEDRLREHRQAKMKSENDVMTRKAKTPSESEDYTTEAIQATSTVKTKDNKDKTIQQSTQKAKSSDEITNHKTSVHLTSLIPSSKSHDQAPSTTEAEPGGGGGNWLTKEQVAEFSKILFKCIKPIGEPEFRITDNIATHTITLKIDMTAIDLRHAEALCTREQVEKYEQLGMRREEIAEVALKLNAIKHLGINLRIDDLFDEQGFMVVDGNEIQEDREDAVYFVEDGRNSIKGKERLIREELARSELVDLRTEKEKVIQREENDSGEGRETDLLQSMTMKIRFMKTVTTEELRSRLVSDSEQVMFESCDQVQMKLTQLELNTVRLMCASTSLASNLGMISNPKDEKDGTEKYLNTNARQPFMDLLLEQGKSSDQSKKGKETTPTKQETTPSPKQKQKSDEAVQMTSNKTGSGSSLSIPIKTHNCQCFACIGSVAAQETEDQCRPLNPIDPSGSQLSIKDVLMAGLEEGANKKIHQNEKEPTSTTTSNNKVTNKTEHVWQNWMSSTNDNMSLDDSDNIKSGAGTGSPTTVAIPETNPSTNNTTSTVAIGNSTSSYCNHAYSSETTPTSLTSCAAAAANQSNDGKQTSNGNGPVRRYCPCCYCELFGHNSPATAPTSHNYTKQRDKMRQKLEKKRNKRDGDIHIRQCPHGYTYHRITPHHTPHNHHEHKQQVSHVTTPLVPPPQSIDPPSLAGVPPAVPPAGEYRSLDELVKFIEGEDATPTTSVAANNIASKNKKKGKKKKVNGQQLISTEPTAAVTTSDITSSNGKGLPEKFKPTNSQTIKKSTQVRSSSASPPLMSAAAHIKSVDKQQHSSPKPHRSKVSKQQHQSNGIGKGHSERVTDHNILMNSSEIDADEDYDQEIEDFKKMCFSSIPVDSRKKLHVSLNMQDIISKMK